MARSLFPRRAYAACANCAHGRPSNDGSHILCIRRGIVEPDYSCRKYRYDPLRRVPRKLPKLPEYNQDEFKI